MDYEEVKNDLRSDNSVRYIGTVLGRILKRRIHDSDLHYIVSVINGCEFRFFNQHSDKPDPMKSMQTHIAGYIAKKMQKKQSLETDYTANADFEDNGELDDTHEYLVRQARHKHNTSVVNHIYDNGNQYVDDTADATTTNIIGMYGLKDTIELAHALNPSALVRSYNIITLDTRNRVLSDSDPSSRNTITWNFNNDHILTQGGVNGIGELQDIVSIEAATMYLPSIENQLYSEYRQITMFIHELSGQSCILTEKTRYHFIFNAEGVDSDAGSTRLKLTPSFDDAPTEFGKPITTLNTITISFAFPAERGTFGYDRAPNPQNVTISNANPAVLDTLVNHGLSNGDIVYLEGVSSTSNVADVSLVTLANQEKGFVIGSTTSNTFELVGLDTSSASGTLSLTGCIFGSQRFFVPLKIKYLTNRKYT